MHSSIKITTNNNVAQNMTQSATQTIKTIQTNSNSININTSMTESTHNKNPKPYRYQN